MSPDAYLRGTLGFLIRTFCLRIYRTSLFIPRRYLFFLDFHQVFHELHGPQVEET